MSINGVSYSNYSMQFWQSLQTKSGSSQSRYTTTGTNNSNLANAFASSSLIDQLTYSIKTAMDTLGLKSGDRVTFNTLTEARKKMEEEFAEKVKSDLRKLGVHQDAEFTFLTDGNGGIKVIMDETVYKTTSSYSKSTSLQEMLKALGLDNDTNFSIESDGAGGFKVVADESASKSVTTLKSSESISAMLEELGLNEDVKFSFESDGKGGLQVVTDASGPQPQIEQYLEDNPDFKEALLKELDLDGDKAFTLNYNGSSDIQLTTDRVSVQEKELKDPKSISTMLEALGLDKDVNFSLASDGKGGFTVVSDDEDLKAAIDQYLKDNPEFKDDLVKDSGLAADKAFTLSYKGSEDIKVSSNRDIATEINDYFKDNPEQKAAFLKEFGLTATSKFSLSYSDTDGIKLTEERSGKEDKAIIEKYLKDNPDIVDAFNQIQSMTNLEQARKAQALDPSTIRKRVQMESLVAWFAGEGMSVDQLFQYSNGQSLFAAAGMNYTV